MDTPVHEYVITRQDYNSAQSLHRSNHRRVSLMYYFWFWFLPAISIAFLLYTLVLIAAKGLLAAQAYTPLAGWALYIAAFMPFLLWNTRRKAMNTLQPKDRRGKPVTVQFDAHQIVSAVPGVSEGRFFWTAIQDFTEDSSVALLYTRKKVFLFIPKRAMDDAEWQRLRTLALPQKAVK